MVFYNELILLIFYEIGVCMAGLVYHYGLAFFLRGV